MKIAIASQKGGVSKTTTAAALAYALNRAGARTLAIDADPQGSLSYLYGADPGKPGLYEVVKGTAAASAAIQETEQGDIIAGSKLLSGAQVPLLRIFETIDRLPHAHVVIDTGPGLTSTTAAALAAADIVIIPAKCNAGSLQGIIDTAETVRVIEKKAGRPQIAGVLLTQIHGRRTNAEKAFFDAIAQTCERLEIPLLKTVVRYGEAAVTGGETWRENVILFDPKSGPAADYMELLAEVQKIIKERER